MTHDEVVRAAGRALSVELRLDEAVVDYPQARALILRCAPAGPAPRLPPVVIVKRWNQVPSDPSGGGFRHELAALDFLGAVAGVDELVPALLGHDIDSKLLVMTDVAVRGEPSGFDSPRLLGNILFGDDPAAAEAALLAFNGALGQLHGATAGRDAEYRRRLDRWHVTTRSPHGVHRLPGALAALPDLFAANGVATNRAVRIDLDAAATAIREPGEFLAFTHGDATPSNALYQDGRIRLLDFETAGFRNVLVDGCFAGIRYLYSVWARQLPEQVRRLGLAAYRSSLAQRCPAAADDGTFSHQLLAGSAGWLAVLCSYLPKVAEADVRWGRSTDRQRIVTGIDHFVALAAEFGGYGALAGAAGRLGRLLRERWPAEDCTMPPYPAFAAGPLAADQAGRVPYSAQ